MGRIFWDEFFSNSDKRVRVGDTVYHGDFLIGTISEVDNPFLGHAKATVTLGSRESYLFVQEKTGMTDWDNIKIYKKTWKDKIINWINRIYDCLRPTITTEEEE